MSDLLPPGANAEDYYQAGLNADPQIVSIDERIEYFRQAVALDPYHLGACCELGKRLQWITGNYAEALKYCDRALAIDPNSFDAWRYRAMVLQRLDRLEEALDNFNQAIALNPEANIGDLWSNRGHLLQHFGRLEEALASFDRAIVAILNPDDDYLDHQFLNRCYGYRGNILFELGRYEDAIAAYEQAQYLEFTEEENKLKAYAALGRENQLLEGYDRRLNYFSAEEVVEGGYKNTPHEVWEQKGDALMQANRYQEALTCYWKAFEIKPGYCQWGITAALRHLGYTEDQINDQIRAGYGIDQSPPSGPHLEDNS